MIHWIPSKLKKFALQKDNPKKMKRLGETERKYLQNILIKKLYPKDTKNAYNISR